MTVILVQLIHAMASGFSLGNWVVKGLKIKWHLMWMLTTLCVLVTSRTFSKTRHRHLGGVLLFNMAATQRENDACPSDKALNSKLVLSTYGETLEGKTKRRYVDKISVIGVDSFVIPLQKCSPECLPPVEACDILSYLVLETSFTRRSSSRILKACLRTIRWCPDL